MKKCRKKHKVGPKAGLAMDKEIKVYLPKHRLNTVQL